MFGCIVACTTHAPWNFGNHYCSFVHLYCTMYTWIWISVEVLFPGINNLSHTRVTVAADIDTKQIVLCTYREGLNLPLWKMFTSRISGIYACRICGKIPVCAYCICSFIQIIYCICSFIQITPPHLIYPLLCHVLILPNLSTLNSLFSWSWLHSRCSRTLQRCKDIYSAATFGSQGFQYLHQPKTKQFTVPFPSVPWRSRACISFQNQQPPTPTTKTIIINCTASSHHHHHHWSCSNISCCSFNIFPLKTFRGVTVHALRDGTSHQNHPSKPKQSTVRRPHEWSCSNIGCCSFKTFPLVLFPVLPVHVVVLAPPTTKTKTTNRSASQIPPAPPSMELQ